MSLYYSLISQLNFYIDSDLGRINPYFLRFTTNWIVAMRYLWALRNTVIISFVLFFLCRFLSSLPVLLSPSEFLINLVYIVIITFAHFLNSSEKYLILFVSVFLLHAKSVRHNFLINLVYISLYYITTTVGNEFCCFRDFNIVISNRYTSLLCHLLLLLRWIDFTVLKLNKANLLHKYVTILPTKWILHISVNFSDP
jgi:hypothetical protein